LETVFALEDDTVVGEDAIRVTEDVLGHLAPTSHPRGPVAVMGIPESRKVVRSCLVPVGVSDPGNVGTLIRSAAAFGLDVAVASGGTDPWSPKALRSAAGGHFSTTIEVGVTFEQLHDRGFTIAAAVPRGGGDPTSLSTLDPVAILVGSEAHGLPEDVLADIEVTIPMKDGMESLNAAVAGAILAFVYAGRRRSVD
jgi:TrmH family RNA methyltransferase